MPVASGVVAEARRQAGQRVGLADVRHLRGRIAVAVLLHHDGGLDLEKPPGQVLPLPVLVCAAPLPVEHQLVAVAVQPVAVAVACVWRGHQRLEL